MSTIVIVSGELPPSVKRLPQILAPHAERQARFEGVEIVGYSGANILRLPGEPTCWEITGSYKVRREQ
jgi:hypothetical protein